MEATADWTRRQRKFTIQLRNAFNFQGPNLKEIEMIKSYQLVETKPGVVLLSWSQLPVHNI